MNAPPDLKNALKKRAAWSVAVFGILLVALVGWFVSFFRDPPEPVYERLKLSNWLDGSTVNLKLPAESELPMVRVMGSVGPEALLWLIREVELTGNRPTELIYRYYERLCRTSSLLKSCLPKVPKPLPNSHLETAEWNSMNLLERLAPGSPYESKALGAVIAAHLEGNRDFYDYRLRVAARFTNFPTVVIPILVAELNNPAHVETAVKGLEKFGPTATSSLYPLAMKEKGLIRPAELALEKADKRAYLRLCEEKDQLGIR